MPESTAAGLGAQHVAADQEMGHLEDLIAEVLRLRAGLLALESGHAEQLAGLSEKHRESGRNLLHYLALRNHDLRRVQERLARRGISSLGRSEAHVLATVDAVLAILHRLAGRSWQPPPGPPPLDFREGRLALEHNARDLLGAAPRARGVRIMVTMPSEAAIDYSLVRRLLAAGMDVMRINCAHDGPDAWDSMIRNLRRAEAEIGRDGVVLMDLAGPKLRTGPLAPGPAVLKWRPRRDALGRVIAPARIWLTAAERPRPAAGLTDATLPVPEVWLRALKDGDTITFRDARGARRELHVVATAESGSWATCGGTAYVTPDMVLVRHARAGRSKARATVADLPGQEQPIVLHTGDLLVLTREQRPGHPATVDAGGNPLTPATIGCTLPEIFADVRPGERIWLDDGKIGGIIRAVDDDEIQVQITQARARGEKLRADKGINLPDSTLHLPALTPRDVQDLAFVAQHADIVGYSFVRSTQDVRALQASLADIGASHLGVMLKIETRAAFEALPSLLLTALCSRCSGVMIARGDLAVECGYERLAELQEEILCVAEAAHMPVIWATQVLERLAEEGIPSRAEISDAAMGERAECVMLNKGPYIVEAVRVLDGILQRMEGHQSKRRAMLRRLRLAGSLQRSIVTPNSADRYVHDNT